MLTPLQLREVMAVLFLAVALLSLVSMLWGGGPLLQGLRQQIERGFGYGWPLPVAGLLFFGGRWMWPAAGRVSRAGVTAALVAGLALLGLLSLGSATAGGSVGRSVAHLIVGLTGGVGAVVVLALGLLVGAIVAFQFSPGAVLAGAAGGIRAAYAERRRLESLVRVPRGSQPGPTSAPEAPLVPVRQGEHLAAALEAPDLPWRTIERPALTGHPTAPPSGPPEDPGTERGADETILKVVADPRDDRPEVAWKLPNTTLLDSVGVRKERMQEEIKRNVRIIEGTLATFGVEAKVVGVNAGPAVTQYELQPGAGVQVKRIVALQNDLSLALAAAPLRIEAPIPGKSAVGVEVPNKSASLVSIREVVESVSFRSGSQALALALGNDVTGQGIVGDLTRMPHLLIAGATGQGKSVCINTLIGSLLLQATPAQLRLVMIDPKRVELNGYNGLPHLAVPVIVEAHQAAAALRWAVAEMDRRYKLLSAEGVRNIAAYNDKAKAQNARSLPYVVVVIDELADLMMVAAGEIEELVCRIAQLARAVGIHLIIATQRPSTDIITGLIKANIPSRIAFAVGSQVDSRVILDSGGAEKLLGRGDMLYQPVDAGKPTRIQGAFISDHEVETLVGFWKAQGEPDYIEEVLDQRAPEPSEADNERRLDPLFSRAARAVAAEGGASVSLVQRKFNVGYSRAGRIVDQLAEHRVVGGYQGSKSREVMMNLPDVDELLERLGLEG